MPLVNVLFFVILVLVAIITILGLYILYLKSHMKATKEKFEKFCLSLCEKIDERLAMEQRPKVPNKN